MSDKIDDALNVFTSVGCEIATAHSTIVEYIEGMQDRIEELQAEVKQLAEGNIKRWERECSLVNENNRLLDAGIEFCTQLVQKTNNPETLRLAQSYIAKLEDSSDE